MEHLQHFRLGADPFRNEPLLRLWVDTEPHRDAALRLDRAVRQAKGLALLIGERGAGKTMVVRRLLESLEEEIFEASMLVVLNGSADAGWLLARFADQLGVEEPARERESLMRQVYERLAIIREDGRHAVLILDDAESLAGGETLSAIASLLKLEYEERRLLSLVLCGTPQLERALARHPQLAHRVDVKARLAALDAGAADLYLSRRIEQSGGNPAILGAGAGEALHRLGRGLPGVMNTLADNALFEAFLCGRADVSRADVERAHRDLSWAGDDPGAAEAAEASTPEEPSPPVSAVLAPEGELAGLDSELEAVFDAACSDEHRAAPRTSVRLRPGEPLDLEQRAHYLPNDGPPKHDEGDIDDLLIELVDE